MSNDVTIYVFLIVYKIAILLSGVGVSYMGFRLFALEKLQSAGDLEAGLGSYSLKLRSAAPGVFFSLFGTAIICFSIFKGVDYKRSYAPEAVVTSKPEASAPGAVKLILPEKAPF